MYFHRLLKTGDLFRISVLVFVMGLLTACGGHVYHIVERGETLYSIGWAYGYDYRQVAQWNGISAPYYLSPGQRLRVAPPMSEPTAPLQEYQPENEVDTGRKKNGAPVVEAFKEPASGTVDEQPSTVTKNVRSVVTQVKQLFGSQNPEWRWPTTDKHVLNTFSAQDPARQGLDISGKRGNPIFAAASGRVVYAGSGLVRYGKLIIINHNEEYLSAYAYNRKLHVKEGDVVKAGQQIADMGSVVMNSGKSRAKLHFEIRRNGKPVDPLRYLPHH